MASAAASPGKFIPSRNMLRAWVLTEYNARKGKMRRQLEKVRLNSHLSFEIWTSPSFYTIISIVAHFIDTKGCRQTKLLAIHQLKEVPRMSKPVTKTGMHAFHLTQFRDAAPAAPELS